MKLFHFTSDFHVQPCTRAGIFMGVIPLSIDTVTGKADFKKGCQWLTVNPDFDQSWNRNSSLPYDRTMYRLTIEIPKIFLKKLLKFDTDLKKIIPAEMYGVLAGDDLDGGDPENWYAYEGVILSSWIKKVERKPNAPK